LCGAGTHARDDFAVRQNRNPTQTASDRPRNLTNIPCCENRVNASNPQNFHAFSTLGRSAQEGIVERRTPSSAGSSKARRMLRIKNRPISRLFDHPRENWRKTTSQRIGASAPHRQLSWNEWFIPVSGFSSTQQYGPPLVSAVYFGTCRGGRQKIEKRTFGGPCFEGTLQKPLILLGISFPNQVPWPGRLRGFNRA
jgi:hypothetical protein